MKNSMITILKIDRLTKEGLSGAVFELSGKTTYTKTTDEDGIITFNMAPCSKFILREISPPEGYDFIETSYNIRTDSCGNIFVDGSRTNLITVENDAKIDPPAVYAVNYLSNGGTGEFSDSEIAYGTNYRVRELVETGISHPGTGFWFSGWNTMPDGSGVSYTENQIIELTGNIVLYAQWFSWHSISYSRNTEAPYVFIESARSDIPYTILGPEDVNIYNEGFEFVSWNTLANGKGNNYYPGDVVTLTGTLRIYAQWKAI